MTEAEQEDVKAKIEKLTAEFAKKVSQLETKLVQLEGEIERKNQALDGFMNENKALRDELGGRGGSGTSGHEDIAQKIQRWKSQGK